MKRKAVILVLVAVTLVVAGAYFWGPSAAPSGQEPLAVLSPENFGAFAAAFDANPDVPRMVLLLSPT